MQSIRDRIEREKAERLKNEWTRVNWRDKCMRAACPLGVTPQTSIFLAPVNRQSMISN